VPWAFSPRQIDLLIGFLLRNGMNICLPPDFLQS